MRKKAQASGGAAAALIGLITLLLIIFIILMPPEERARLLGQEESEGSTDEVPENILLSAAVGQLNYVSETTVPHLIPNIVLEESRDAIILEEINPFIISKGVASVKQKEITFKLADAEHTENVLLTFKTPVHDGTLKIRFNGFEIFESGVTTETPQPVKIRNEYLQPINTIVFQVEGFGFPSKEYSFENMKIIGELIDANKLKATETLPLRSFEYSSMDNAVLEYYAICNQFNVGNLDIAINSKKIFSGIPSCDSVNRQGLFKDDLAEGKNTIEFGIEKGAMRLELMKLSTYLRPSSRYTEFFTIDTALYEQVKSGEKTIVLEINFLDDARTKKAKTNVNGKYDIVEQKEPVFKRDISEIAVNGNNFLEITPMTDIYITKVQVRIE